PSTGTPSDSSSSAVAGTSSSDLTPAETTSAGVRASCARSALTSGGCGKPRWTPPRPPVASQAMPADRATASVPPTVVAPTARCSTATARSRGPILRAPASKRSSSAAVRPTTTSPSRTPIVAGTAPAARTCRSDSRPTSTPSPGGKPCATSVVSSATTDRDSRTSSETRITRVSAGCRDVRASSGQSRRPLHLDEPRPVVARDFAEAGAPVRAQRTLVPPGDPEAKALRPPLRTRVVEPRLDERLRETAAGQIGPHPEPEPHLVAFADEVEEPDELAVVADHGPQAVAPRGMREELDPPRIRRGVVPLVRKLVLPLADGRSVHLGHGPDSHGSEPTRATHRAAAARPRRAASSSEPPRRNPAASASPAPVVSTTSPGTAARSRRASAVTIVQPRAPRFSTPVGAVRYAPPSISHSASVANSTSGAIVSSSSRNRTGPYERISVHAATSTEMRAPRARASRTARSAADEIGSRSSA